MCDKMSVVFLLLCGPMQIEEFFSYFIKLLFLIRLRGRI